MSALTELEFTSYGPPFKRWWGPYSPARGDHFGFRFHASTLGTWSSGTYGREWWELKRCPAVDDLTRLVRSHWGGGRVLILPNGYVIKPLQADSERGIRVVVGRLLGPKSLISPDGLILEMEHPSGVVPGGAWPGPKTIGLECIMFRDGSLECAWCHPTAYGLDKVRMKIKGPDPEFAAWFRSARPGAGAGRVRVTLNRQVITNRRRSDGDWETRYVGRLNTWIHKNSWIGEVIG